MTRIATPMPATMSGSGDRSDTSGRAASRILRDDDRRGASAPNIAADYSSRYVADRPMIGLWPHGCTASRFLISVFALATVAGTVVPAYAAPTNVGPVADTRFGVAEGFRNPARHGRHRRRLGAPGPALGPDPARPSRRLQPSGPDADPQSAPERAQPRHRHRRACCSSRPPGPPPIPADGKRSVPKNLGLAFDDPNNYFGQYVYQTVEVLRRPDRPVDHLERARVQAGRRRRGGSFTWLGSDEEFAQLMKVGYLAAKKANPNAIVSFPGTSYWVDVNSNRPLFYDRILAILAQDPNAAANNFFHDVVSLNLYRAPDDVYRVHGVFKAVQTVWPRQARLADRDQRHAVRRHARSRAPTSTPAKRSRRPWTSRRRTRIQSLALAAAAGYTQDRVLSDGRRQRVRRARAVGPDPRRRHAAPGQRRAARWPSAISAATPAPSSCRWRAKRRPGRPGRTIPTRWCPTGRSTRSPSTSRAISASPRCGMATAPTCGSACRKNGSSAQLVDRAGPQPGAAGQPGLVGGRPARGDRVLQDQRSDQGSRGVPLHRRRSVAAGRRRASTRQSPVVAPALGDPGSVAREFKVFVNPEDGQTVGSGQPAEFFASTRGYEGFADPISFSVVQWSTPAVSRGQGWRLAAARRQRAGRHQPATRQPCTSKPLAPIPASTSSKSRPTAAASAASFDLALARSSAPALCRPWSQSRQGPALPLTEASTRHS